MLNHIIKKYTKFSDVFLISGQYAQIKVNGNIERITLPSTNDKPFIVTDKYIIDHIIKKLPTIEQKKYDSFIKKSNDNTKEDLEGEKDFSLKTNLASFRVNLFKSIDGLSAVLRLIPTQIPEFKTLNLPMSILETVDYTSGLVLVTGVTGSGKSTTLSSIINLINKEKNKHILTIEDPIEFKYKADKSIISQREVGKNTESFPKALRAALREAPDVILVGEMRDKETIETAIKAAETGHLVLSTLHTYSAVQTLERIISVFDGNDKKMIESSLANVLKLIISQKLIKNREDKITIAYEVLFNSKSVANNIRDGQLLQIPNSAKSSKENKDKNIFLNECLMNLYRKNELTKDLMLNYSYDKEDLLKLLNE